MDYKFSQKNSNEIVFLVLEITQVENELPFYVALASAFPFLGGQVISYL